jgi:drug/metabolite transporter (DMT)-like permease
MTKMIMSDKTKGWLNGMLGVLVFSGSMPATRAAVTGFDPLFLTSARATIAGTLACLLMLALRSSLPKRQDLLSLAIVAIGVVVGFPLLSAFALQHITSARSLVFLGLLPLGTALFGVLRGGERPAPIFWLFALMGGMIIGGFALSRGADSSVKGDLLILAAVAICSLGYAEGGALSRRLGGLRVICWALILSLPAMAPVALLARPADFAPVPADAWAGLGYVSLFSMLIGFIFWYRGLALGGIAAVGQLQLLQPMFGLALSALLLHEPVGWPMLAATAGIILCVAGARRFSHPAQVLRGVPRQAALGKEME